jgi:hypothetical protein
MACLLGAAVVAGLHAVGVPPVPRALGGLALLTVPLVVKELNGPYTDLPSLAWTACAAALCAAAPRRPAALAVAIVAMGLAVGTKTTALLPSVLLLGPWSASRAVPAPRGGCWPEQARSPSSWAHPGTCAICSRTARPSGRSRSFPGEIRNRPS